MGKIKRITLAILSAFCVLSIGTPIYAEEESETEVQVQRTEETETSNNEVTVELQKADGISTFEMTAVEENIGVQSISVSEGWTAFGTTEWQIDDWGTLTIRPINNGTSGVLSEPEIYDEKNYKSFPWDGNQLVKNLKVQNGVKAGKLLYNFCNQLTNLSSVDLSGLDTSNTTNMNDMFANCKSLTTLDLSKFDTANVTSMTSMFYGCDSLITLDLSNFNTSNVIESGMSFMFYGCNSLKTLDLSTFQTSNITSLRKMFCNCKSLTTLDLSKFNTTNVTDMSEMFYGCNSLITLDLSKFNTAKVTNMWEMFGGCKSLVSLDVSSFDTSNVTDFSWMFTECSSLKTLDISNFKTINAGTMAGMFANCYSLNSLDLTNFKTSNVTDMGQMFMGCKSISTLNLSNFDTSKVTNMPSMFINCASIEKLDLTNFKTSKLVYMDTMFAYCDNLTSVDLSSFDTSNVRSMEYIFSESNSLKQITLGDKFNFIEDNLGQQPNFPRKDGEWVSSVDGKGYAYNKIPSRVAATYTFQVKFADIDSSNTPHATEVEWLAEQGISEGWPLEDGSKEFRPYNEVARCDMAAFIRRLAKNLNISDAKDWKPTEEDWNTFTDVDKDTPHAEDVLWLAHAEISTGWEESNGTKTFRSLQSVARCDMAAFLRRLAKLQEGSDVKTWTPTEEDWKTFSDVNKTSDHAEDVLWLAHAGISTGWDESDGTKTFRPLQSVARCDMAAFLYRLAN